MTSSDCPAETQDPLTLLSHKLIRTACRDDFDPFMVGTKPDNDGPIVRACFYYAVVVTPKHTVLFDNEGRGGMCDFTPDEMLAAWETPALLESQGITLDQLHLPGHALGDQAVPKPVQIDNDLPSFDPDEPHRKVLVGEAYLDPQFEGRVPLTQLLKRDVELLCFMVEQGCSLTSDAEPEPEAVQASAVRRPKMG